MLFLPQSVYEERRRLSDEFAEGKIQGDVFCRKALELDPDDFIALTGMGKVFRDAGDPEAAESYYWRAIEANPCASAPYMQLGRLLWQREESRPLASAVNELGLLKLSREDDEESPQPPVLPGSREGEPEEVTVRMRQLRLIERMQEELELSAETVDAIVAEGHAIVPLLVGVLRAWAQDFYEEYDDGDLENALALIGETGSPREIPHLLELANVEDETASGASTWALLRIVGRFPEESAKLIESLLPSLRSVDRLKVAELIARERRLDPAGTLLAWLGENIESIPKDERDAFVPMLVGAMLSARGREGASLARAALRRHGGLLSRASRRECEDVIADFADAGFPSGPPDLPSPTVYDICAGEMDWSRELDGEDEFGDEYLPPPEPIRRQAIPGRNDPCWCNSGKKYKKCHLDSDARDAGRPSQPAEREFNHLRKAIGEFLGQVLPKREMQQAIAEIFGDDPDDAEAPDQIVLLDWMIHDRLSPVLGGTVMEEFLKRRSRLTETERGMVEAWSRSYIGLYEVQQLKPGVGVELKDLIFGETLFAHDVSMSTRLVKWDGLLARVVPGERGTELAGAALTVPRIHLPHFREWLDEDREASGLEWRSYLKNNWPRIRRQSLEIAANRADSLQLTNTDGEQLLFSKTFYTVIDEVAVISALQLHSEFSDSSREDEAAANFVWMNDAKTVLGNIRIEGGELTLECNSRERSRRGKRLLSDAVGAALRHVRDEFTTMDKLKRQAKEAPSRPAPSHDEIPKEVRDEVIGKVLAQHYKSWPDTKLPALDGKTPRQAVKTARGREQVIDLLKLFESGEARKAQSGETPFDFSKLRAELGLAD